MVLKITFEKRASEDYFKKLNLNLTGIVTDVQTVTGGNGMLYVDIRNSNIKDYDIRKDGGYYYCVIHNGKADIITHTSDINIGDSIIINCNKMMCKILRGDSLIRRERLHLNQFDLSFSSIKKVHRLDFFLSRYSTPSK
jgi:hypothetical protein